MRYTYSKRSYDDFSMGVCVCVGVIIFVIIVRVEFFFCVGRDKTCILLCQTNTLIRDKKKPHTISVILLIWQRAR